MVGTAQPRLLSVDRDGVADADGATGDDFRKDAALVTAELPGQRGRGFKVAGGGVGIDIDGSATRDRLDHLEPDVADGEGLAYQIELVPGGPAAEIEVGAKAQGVDGDADHGLDGGNAREIDDRDQFANVIREAVAAAGQELWRALQV